MNPADPVAGRTATGALLTLALPIIGVNIGMMLMGTVDTIMVGRVSPEALAAVALGNVVFFALSIFGVGVLLAVDPIISQAVGARNHLGVALGAQRGLIVAAVLSVPISAALFGAGPALRLFQQPEGVVPLAAIYCAILVPGVLPFFAFNVGRQTLQAMHRVAPVLWAIGVANLLNIALNRLLIFGGLGIPAMGVAGSAWATTISRIVTLPLLLYFARRELIPLLRPWLPAAARLAPLRAMLRIGLPIGVQLELEMSAFAAVALLMGRFGTIQVAGHQIALNLASLTFMVPMGIGMGAAVLAGNAVGRADAPGLRAASRAALGTGVAFMSCTALLFLVLPGLLAGIYTNDVAVLGFAATLLPIAGVFQVFDGVQVVAAGILRGLGDTRAPMLINLAGFTGVGLSMSLYLGFHTSLGAIGLWWGLVIGLATVAGILLIRLRHALRRPVTSWHVHPTG